MDKLTRYEFEATVDGGTIPIKSEDGYWFHRYEVMTEIEKLESEKAELLKTLNDAREFVQYYAEAGFPDAIELDKQILGIIVAKSKGQQ